MGSKRLKAIAVFGTGTVPVADPKRIQALNKRVGAVMKSSPIGKAFGAMGTGSTTPASALSGESPVKNWGGVGVVDFGVENVQKVGSAEMDRYKKKLMDLIGEDMEESSSEMLKKATFLVNKTGAKRDNILNDGDEIIILYPIGGG